ncbi:unnamed protein product, partial [Closterium sp. Naga37s-1]
KLVALGQGELTDGASIVDAAAAIGTAWGAGASATAATAAADASGAAATSSSPRGTVWHRGAPWQGHVGSWLKSLPPSALTVTVHEPAFGRTCPGDCSGNGVCNAEFGECRCRHGYTGPDCSQTEDYPCNLPATPESPLGPWIVSICAAHCDLRRAQCRCGPNTNYPDRPVVAPCGFPKAP